MNEGHDLNGSVELEIMIDTGNVGGRNEGLELNVNEEPRNIGVDENDDEIDIRADGNGDERVVGVDMN